MRLLTENIPPNLIAGIERIRGSKLPVTREQAKAWGRITYSYEDHEVDALLDMAVEDAERFTNRSLVDSSVTVVYSSFGRKISLPYGPVDEVVSVRVGDTDLDYILEGDYLVINDFWQFGALTVEYKTKAEVPAGLIIAIQKAIVSHFEDRQDVGQGGFGMLPNSSVSILRRYKRY